MSSDKIRIDTDKLDDISQQLERLSSSLTSISTSMAGIISTARFTVPEQPDIARNLYKLKNRVSASSMYARKLSGAVRGASAQWAAAESKIAGQQIGKGEDSSQSGGSGSGAKEKGYWDYVLDGLIKAIGGACPGGKIISALWSGITKGNVKDWLKALVDIGGAGYNIVSKWDCGWKEAIFKIGAPLKSFGENMANPVSWITNGLKAVIDNWDILEKGNTSRFMNEVVVETATNVALTAGGYALAALALGALGVGGAPVLAVGALGAVFVWGVNEIAKIASGGKGVAEILGDAAGDLTDWIVEKKHQVKNWIAEKASDTAEWVIDKGKQLLDTGAKALSDAKDTVCGWFAPIFA